MDLLKPQCKRSSIKLLVNCNNYVDESGPLNDVIDIIKLYNIDGNKYRLHDL